MRRNDSGDIALALRAGALLVAEAAARAAGEDRLRLRQFAEALQSAETDADYEPALSETLAEAFARPKIINRFAKLGFSQSYHYFPWRNSKSELETYFTELTRTEVREYLRPNLWPNYGIYGPAYELMNETSTIFLRGRHEKNKNQRDAHPARRQLAMDGKPALV